VIKIKSIGGIVPTWKSDEDAGLDLHAAVNMTVLPHSQQIVPLGIQTQFSSIYVALIKDRSGLAAKGIHILAGVIDSSYRGEWKVIMLNTSDEPLLIIRGARIAQVLFLAVRHLEIVTVDSLDVSGRGCSGFGSSGI